MPGLNTVASFIREQHVIHHFLERYSLHSAPLRHVFGLHTSCLPDVQVCFISKRGNKISMWVVGKPDGSPLPMHFKDVIEAPCRCVEAVKVAVSGKAVQETSAGRHSSRHKACFILLLS